MYVFIYKSLFTYVYVELQWLSLHSPTNFFRFFDALSPDNSPTPLSRQPTPHAWHDVHELVGIYAGSIVVVGGGIFVVGDPLAWFGFGLCYIFSSCKNFFAGYFNANSGDLPIHSLYIHTHTHTSTHASQQQQQAKATTTKAKPIKGGEIVF